MTVSQLLPLKDTAEVEIVEFLLGNNLYGTYVQNVREVINVLPITPVPLTHPCMQGLIKLREEVMTVIDLAKCLGYSSGREKRQVPDKYIIAEIRPKSLLFMFKRHQEFIGSIKQRLKQQTRMSKECAEIVWVLSK
ncbi:chemotaxis protein CheW [Paenibacillus sp. FSL R5-0475]|uniref:chemotaxis protein CheW n=1 Tax=Paenibacillus sp. FSL R5-0475 TaxID=2921643 RepID=UPI0030FB3934